ncbi:hypothetical protein [Haemophilus haemolyticus]|uniref:hypothetical protein n=1 Tax=Haemophilus haemolyticus TaxID=726 RepID=UPI000E56D98B|nr:hypothetical protein [Haemophilus haemolyticus]
MGFWSSVGSFISNAASTVSNAVSSVVSTVSDVASSAWNTTKRVVSKAASWVMDKAESFVETVKETWQKVKPFVQKIRPWVQAAAKVAPWPWLRTGLEVVAKGLEFLEKLDKSPLLDKVKKAIDWAIEAAKNLRKLFGKTEQEEAEQRRKDLEEAAKLAKTEEQRKSFYFAQLINEYVLVSTKVDDLLDSGEFQDFEHYLRLRATQKLLKATEKRLKQAQRLEDITGDDVFLLQVGAKLLNEVPELTNEDALKLDRIIKRRFNGKSLLPFVFEELVYSWTLKLNQMEQEWDSLNKDISKLKTSLRQLKIKGQIEKLSILEEADIIKLSEDIRDNSYLLNEKQISNRSMKTYILAAEGFLQILEKTEDYWIEQDKEWILEDSQEVGLLIIECAENNKPWDELTDDQQSIISDFANIFAEDSKQRRKEMMKEIEFEAEEIEVTV